MVRIIESDVAVIGGGLAGLTAALEAKRENLNVSLVCKSKAGCSGNTLVSGAAISVVNLEKASGDSAFLLEQDILSSGAGINDPVLCRVFSEESVTVLKTLRQYGVKFREINGKMLVLQPPGHSAVRYFPSEFKDLPYKNMGLALTCPLLEQAERRGISIVNHTTILRLLIRNNRIYGAMAMDNRTGELLFFRARAVILAAGGGAGLFANNNNTTDVSCDSYGLAYEAGAVLRDMEMVQFYPTMMYEPMRIPITNPLFGDGAVLKNIIGEEFLYRYSKKGNLATRDIMARASKIEIDSGRGNPKYVFVDCSNINKDILKKKYGKLAKILEKSGLDISRDLLPVAPCAHFYIGGIVTDRRCATSVDGLLACGEAMGGLHGANRLAGVALAETVVFGRIAGRTAAALSAKHCEDLPDVDGYVEIPRGGKGGNIHELKAMLQEAMWHCASIVRSESSLMKAKKVIDEIARAADSARMKDIKDTLDYFILRAMINTSRMLVACSLLRKETRGSFCREEYPERDDKFIGNFFVRKTVRSTMEVQFRKIGE